MTIVEHLEELRRVLIISAIAWLVATVAAFVFHGAIFAFLLHPLSTVLNKTNNHLTSTAIFTSPTEGLTIPIKISAIVGVIGALPVVSGRSGRSSPQGCARWSASSSDRSSAPHSCSSRAVPPSRTT